MALSVVAIKVAKSRDKANKLSDSDGLYPLVTPAGGRYWRMNYRHLGKQKPLVFGVWPENTTDAALRRMGYAQDQMAGHGFRAMAATLLNEMGLWYADAIERQLAHCDSNAVRRAYTRGEYWDDRVRM